MNLCKDCKFCTGAGTVIGAQCFRSSLIDPVTGNAKPDGFCASERAEGNPCGPDGKFFQPIESPP